MRAQAPSRPRLPPCAPRQQPCRCARRRRPCRARAGAAEGAPAPDKRRAAVVGGGWAAFAAAWTLTRSGFDVTLLDAAQTPGGVAAGQAELGVKGAWRHYRNFERLHEQLGLPLRERYTDYAETAFYSTRGLEVLSPVLGDKEPWLPSPLGPLVYTSDRFTDLPLSDRLSAAPLTRALVEFDLDEEAYAEYDCVSFEALCLESGVSRGLYERFLEPVLCALAFAPPRELSAAAALAALYNYVLAHQGDFDVRWPTTKAGSGDVFGRWAEQLRARGCEIRGGAPVARVLADADGRRVLGVETASGETIDADVVVLACGAAALPRVVANSGGAVAGCRGLRRVGELRCSAVAAARLELSPGAAPLPLPHVANVFSGTRDVAGTLFDVGALQGGAPGRVVEVDTYNAAGLVDASDEDVVAAARRALAIAGGSGWERAELGDVRIARVRNAATRFSPGSHACTPSLKPEGAPRGLYVAGDLVKQGPAEFDAHLGARGLSQEKALVTGLAAGRAAATDFGQRADPQCAPLAVERDEPHIAAAREAARAARAAGVRLPVLW